MGRGTRTEMKKKFEVWSLVYTVFLLLMVVTVCLLCLPGMWGRFYTQASGSDSARVAKFQVEVTRSLGEAETMSIHTGEPKNDYKITIKNNSEVAVGYKIIVTFDTALPEGIWISLDEGEPRRENGTTVYEFSGFQFAVGEQSKTHELHFEMDAGVLAEDYTAADNTPNVKVTVVAEQLD